MKNLSLYDNDLSVPRKQDVDDKQDQIKVKGVLEGDGTGGINAAETENAELVELTKELVGLGNVDNVKQYSATNPPPYPVTSVNGKTGNVTIDIPTAGTSISTSGTQPTGQSTGDYWYRIIGRANM